MTDTCDNDTKRCDRAADTDPCARDTPLFPTGGAGPVHVDYGVATNTLDTNHAVAFEVVFDSIFVIFVSSSGNEDQIVYRIGGETYNALVSTSFYVLSTGGNGITTNNLATKTASNAAITTICSMDFYGLFLGVSGATKVIRLEFDIAHDNNWAPQATITKSSGV